MSLGKAFSSHIGLVQDTHTNARRLPRSSSILARIRWSPVSARFFCANLVRMTPDRDSFINTGISKANEAVTLP
jgi:hypothetical protein